MELSRPIKLLPDNMINRIAAGEVVERPAAVLKELVENSLDAGADRIDIEVLSGGKKLIRIRDNGSGMDEDNLLMCLERHATSKIDSESDLLHIPTLGFRGEALASIAAVSNLSITSSTGGGQGHVVTVNGGTLGGIKPAPANKGTTVEVANIFFNVPGRRKFLKSDHTEAAHLLDVAQAYALSREGLRLTYREGAREVLSVDSSHDFQTRVYKVLGRQAAEGLIPFEYESGNLRIAGWLGAPERVLRSTSNLFMYVLGRPVKDRLLNRALAGGYGRLLQPGTWPTAIVFIDLDPGDVDVNVHPAKAEVRFREAGRVFSALSEAVGRAVGYGAVGGGEMKDLAPQALAPDYIKEPPLFSASASEAASASTVPGFTKPVDYSTLSKDDMGLPWMVSAASPEASPAPLFEPQAENYRSSDKGGQPVTYQAPVEARQAAASFSEPSGDRPPAESLSENLSAQPAMPRGNLGDLAELRPLAQLYDSYILAQGSKGLYIIDQHAGHERVIYNQLKEKLAANGLPGQAMLFPETIELSPHQALAAEKLTLHLERLGFDLSHFGDRTFILKSVPAILGTNDPLPPLLEILSSGHSRLKSLEGAGLTEALETMANSWLYSLACRAAIKAGYKLSLEAMTSLINDMAATPNGAYCPHGRPAIQLIDRFTIEKRFDRR